MPAVWSRCSKGFESELFRTVRNACTLYRDAICAAHQKGDTHPNGGCTGAFISMGGRRLMGHGGFGCPGTRIGDKHQMIFYHSGENREILGSKVQFLEFSRRTVDHGSWASGRSWPEGSTPCSHT
eukprot:gene9031-biopygen15217